MKGMYKASDIRRDGLLKMKKLKERDISKTTPQSDKDAKPMIYTYQGKNIEYLSREELLEALRLAIQVNESNERLREQDSRMQELFKRGKV